MNTPMIHTFAETNALFCLMNNEVDEAREILQKMNMKELNVYLDQLAKLIQIVESIYDARYWEE